MHSGQLRSASRVGFALAAAGCYLLSPHAFGHEEGWGCRHGHASAEAASDESAVRHYAPDRAVDVIHVKADVTPDFERQTIAGTARIEFKPISEPLEALELDGVDLAIKDVRASREIRDYSVGDATISIVFAEPIGVGDEAWVEVDYSAEPKMGLYFRTPAHGTPEGDVHCFTQGEPHEAHHWLPCIDWPNERSTTELVCRVPPDMSVVSNGTFVSEARVGDSLKAVHWKQAKSHPSYLICFVAGNLSKVEARHGDIPLGFYIQPSKAEYAGSMFDGTADMMAFFENEIGVPYPWDKYDQATIGDFLWGGMENTTVTTLSQRALAEPASENVREARGLVAHELAHQWFGDYVTCKDWSQLWLNEGFATYYAHLYEGHKFGRDALLYGLYCDARDEIFPESPDTRPIAYRRYKSPEEQFDFRAYPKGSWVLHMLRSQLGEELYRRAVQTYVERHALGDVDSEDLREVFEELSGRTLDRFFDQWVYHGGLPELSIRYEWLAKERKAHVSIDQTQDVDDDVLLFHMPVKLRFVIDGKAVDEEIEIDAKHHDFYVALDEAPSVVRFDPNYSVLTRVKFPLPEAMQIAQLEQEDDAIGRVLACEGLGRRSSSRAVDALQAALNGDEFFGVREAAAAALGKIASDEAVAALAESLDQEDARVRRAVVEALGKCYSDAAREKLLAIVRDEPNPAVAAAAAAGLARTVSDESTAALRDALASKSLRNERSAAAVKAIGEFHRTDLADDLRRTLDERALELDSRDYEAGLAALAKISRSGKRRDAAFEFLADRLDSAREPVRLGAVEALGELGDDRARELLEPLTGDASNSRVARAATMALAALDESTPQAPAELSALRREVRTLREQQTKLQKSLEELKAKSAAGEPARVSGAGEGDADQ